MAFILYHTQGCHLCEQAESLIRPLLNPGTELQLVDLLEDADALAVYAEKIPVFVNTQSKDVLCWPFNAQDVMHFIEGSAL